MKKWKQIDWNGIAMLYTFTGIASVIGAYYYHESFITAIAISFAIVSFLVGCAIIKIIVE